MPILIDADNVKMTRGLVVAADKQMVRTLFEANGVQMTHIFFAADGDETQKIRGDANDAKMAGELVDIDETSGC